EQVYRCGVERSGHRRIGDRVSTCRSVRQSYYRSSGGNNARDSCISSKITEVERDDVSIFGTSLNVHCSIVSGGAGEQLVAVKFGIGQNAGDLLSQNVHFGLHVRSVTLLVSVVTSLNCKFPHALQH